MKKNRHGCSTVHLFMLCQMHVRRRQSKHYCQYDSLKSIFIWSVFTAAMFALMASRCPLHPLSTFFDQIEKV